MYAISVTYTKCIRKLWDISKWWHCWRIAPWNVNCQQVRLVRIIVHTYISMRYYSQQLSSSLPLLSSTTTTTAITTNNVIIVTKVIVVDIVVLVLILVIIIITITIIIVVINISNSHKKTEWKFFQIGKKIFGNSLIKLNFNFQVHKTKFSLNTNQ